MCNKDVPITCIIRNALWGRRSPSNIFCPFWLKRCRKCKTCGELLKAETEIRAAFIDGVNAGKKARCFYEANRKN